MRAVQPSVDRLLQLIQIQPDMCSIQFSLQITGQFLNHLLNIIFRFPDILP